MVEFKQTGIKTFQNIELKDFTWSIKSVNYDWVNAKAYIEIHAKELHAVHSRTFEFNVPEEWTSESVLSACLSLDCLSGSKLIESE